MSQTDVITLPKVLGKVPEVVMNLPGLIKGSRMSKITDTTRPLGLGVAFEKVAANNPDGLAVIYRDRRYTYRQFNAWANRIADYLASIGLKKGDTVALDMENRPEFPATLIGCAKLGVCAALINTSQKGKVLIHSFNLVKPKAAIIGQELVDVIQEVRDHLDLKENFFYFADQDTLADPGTAPEGFTNLAAAIQGCSSENPESTPPDLPARPAVLHLHLRHHRHAQGGGVQPRPLGEGPRRVRLLLGAADENRPALLHPAVLSRHRPGGLLGLGDRRPGLPGSGQALLRQPLLGRHPQAPLHRLRLRRRAVPLPARAAPETR